MSDDRLKGWKEISECLHVGERTAQRWEIAHGLPVYRIGAGRSAVVFASRVEVEEWLRSAQGTKARSEPAGNDGAANGNGAHAAGDGQAARFPGGEQPVTGVLRRAAALIAPTARGWWYVGGVAVLAALVVAFAVRSQPPQPHAAAPPPKVHRTPPVLFRLTFADGASGTFGSAVGALAKWTRRPDGPTYGMITEQADGGLRVHIYRVGPNDPGGKPELTELTAFTLRPGETHSIPGGHDIVAIEWRADQPKPAKGLP